MSGKFSYARRMLRFPANIFATQALLNTTRLDLTYCRGDVSSTRRVSSSFTDCVHCLRSCAMWVAVIDLLKYIYEVYGSGMKINFHLITVFSYSINPSFLRSPSASHSVNIAIQSYMENHVIAHSYRMSKKIQTPLLNSLDNVVLPFWSTQNCNSSILMALK